MTSAESDVSSGVRLHSNRFSVAWYGPNGALAMTGALFSQILLFVICDPIGYQIVDFKYPPETCFQELGHQVAPLELLVLQALKKLCFHRQQCLKINISSQV